VKSRILIDQIILEGQLNDELQTLEDELKRKYPQLDILAIYARSEDHFPHVYIASIEVDPQYRGQGIGAKVIDEIKDWAKAKGVPIMLSRDDKRGRKAPLDRFYGRLGFAKNKGPRREMRGTGTHIWRPAQA
jgi:GNAT superfamily N-acetyltransferase